jgi:hypothetical protein
MADGLFGDISTSLDPYLGQTVGAGIAAQLAADPSRLAYGSDPLGQAMGQIMGGFQQARATNLAQALAQQRQAAIPDIAAAYASPDAAQWAAQNVKTANPYAMSRVLGGLSPAGVAEMRLQAAEAEHQRAGAALEVLQAAKLGLTIDEFRRKFGGGAVQAGGGQTPPGGGAAQPAPGPALQLVNDPGLFKGNPSGTYGGSPAGAGAGAEPAQAQADSDRAVLSKIPYGTGAAAWFAQQKPEVQKQIRAAWARSGRAPTAVAAAPPTTATPTQPSASA